jgi:hypothetical protein
MENGKQMEKFNLERALAGEPVCTRDGREVTQLTLFDIDSRYQLRGVLKKEVVSWTNDGDYYDDKDEDNQKDLFMKPKENAIWINVYKNENGFLYTTGVDFSSEESAKTSADNCGYIRTIKIVK